jgi:2-phosphosulfolactate phosphatase
VVVDVLWFSTIISLVAEAGAIATLERHHDRGGDTQAPNPSALFDLALGAGHGQRLAIPDPNHAVLALAAAEYGAQHVMAGCLRNARATAAMIDHLVGPDAGVGVVVVGERWRQQTGPLRPAVEDLLGAGAIIAALDPAAAVGGARSSPEAAAARAAFLDARPLMTDTLMRTATAYALRQQRHTAPTVEHDTAEDLIMLASAVDVTDTAAVLTDGEFRPVDTAAFTR